MDNTIDTRPTKSFFVDMLTRDISVTAAILDLCDNALGRTFDLADIEPSEYIIEGDTGRKRLKRFFLHLDVSASRITIKDNCGGISQKDAHDEIFRLGRQISEPTEAGLSVYGIGMKRAFFKLGDHVSMGSSPNGQWWEVDFKVSDWKKQGDDDWTLQFKKIGSNNRPATIPQKGTVIDLRDLRTGTKALLETKTFTNDLRHRLQSAYSLFTGYGLDLRLNKVPVENVLPELTSDPLPPARKSFKAGKVSVVIVVGLTPKTAQTGSAGSGWFVYCNGRLVVEADKSRLTGWGEGLQQWHSKFNRFVGFVFFDSKDGYALPWTTTKQGLVEDSEIFLRTRQEMLVQARPVLDFLTRLYPADIPEEGVHERVLLESAGRMPLASIQKTDRAFVAPRSRSKKGELVNIQYKKSVVKVDMVRSKLGRWLSASEVGSRTFDHFIKTECE